MNAITHPAPVSTRERLLAAAAGLACAEGWANVTMGKLAARVGVSRQTVYNELGSKTELAEALMRRETDRFADGVADVLGRHPRSPAEGVTEAFRYTLESARANPLLRIVLGGPQSDPDGLLPLLTTRSGPVLARAVALVAPMLGRGYPETELSSSDWAVAVEVFVRLLLSHLLQPAGSVEQATGQMRWLAGRMLDGRAGPLPPPARPPAGP